MSLCTLRGVGKTYDRGEKVSPLKALDLSVDRGDFISIQGESGIGKTTLLMIMGGLLRPTEGSVFYDDRDSRGMSEHALTSWRGAHIGFLFQNIQMVSALTIEENIVLSRRLGGKKRAMEGFDTEHLLARFGLAEKRNCLPHQLSGGQRRRAMIVATLARKPELLLADEPTNDLDKDWGGQVMDLFGEWAACGGAVVLVTHHQEYAEKAKIGYKMQNGMVVRQKENEQTGG